jgi:anti-sigma-K factor RskA
MNCDDLRSDYAAWAMGTAEDPERSEITAHLERHCDVCVPGVRSALATVTSMSLAVKQVDPPKRLRKRILALVMPEPGGSWFSVWLPWTVAAALAIALIVVAIPRVTTPGAVRPGEVAYQEVINILNDPLTKDAAFGEPAARGRFFVSPAKGVVFIAAHLPKLDPGRTFEMWVIPDGGKPIPAGTFHALSDSSAVHFHPGPVSAAAMAISVEPDGGSPQPTTTPIIVTKL